MFRRRIVVSGPVQKKKDPEAVSQAEVLNIWATQSASAAQPSVASECEKHESSTSEESIWKLGSFFLVES